jgi:hypothetical protein
MSGAVSPLPAYVFRVCTDAFGPFTILPACYTVPIVLLSIAVIFSTVPLHSIWDTKRAFQLRCFEKVTFQLPAFYVTRKFITMFTTFRQPQCNTPPPILLAYPD